MMIMMMMGGLRVQTSSGQRSSAISFKRECTINPIMGTQTRSSWGYTNLRINHGFGKFDLFFFLKYANKYILKLLTRCSFPDKGREPMELLGTC